MIKIYTKYPVVTKNEEGELPDPENPEIKYTQEMMGFVVVSLKPFMVDQGLKNLELKYPLFEYQEESLFKHHELFFPLEHEEEIVEIRRERIEAARKEKYSSKPVSGILE